MKKKRAITLALIMTALFASANGNEKGKNSQINSLVQKEQEKVPEDASVTALENKDQFFEKYFFVGFAEVYSGMNKNNGDTEIIEDTTDYKEHYSKGRVNLYLKGKIKGKYLLTAWMDTDENELDELFNGLTDRDVNTIFEKIDPEEYYPIYGDDSTRVKDVATSGKMYIALESDKFKFLWGNYKVNYNENGLISYTKKLYGLNTSYKGEKVEINAFLYDPYSLSSIDNIQSTGGMLYYLRNRDLIIDSETIKVELRDSSTNRVLKTVTLIQNEDYKISYTSGRIILNKNIRAHFSDSIIENLDGYDTYYLVATYDYEPDSMNTKESNYGLEADYKLNNENKLTANYISDRQDDGDDYELYGLDWTYKSDKTKIKTGYATSKNELSQNFISSDGGLNYTRRTINANDDNSEAWNVEIERKIDDDKEFKSYYKYLEDGFSNGNELTDGDKTNFGLELSAKVLETNSKFTYDKKIRLDENTDLYTLSSSKKQTDKLTLKSELEYQIDDDKTATNDDESDLTGALGFSYMLTENRELYASQQLTLDNSENESNNMTKIGTKISHNKWRINAEAGDGNQKSMLKLETGYQMNESSEIYTGFERTFDDDDGIETTNTVGTKTALNERTDIYGEVQTGESDSETSQSNVIGLDYIPAEKWLLSLDYTKSDVDVKSGGNTERDIITTGARYKGERLKNKIKAEYRKDSGNSSLNQKILTTDISWKQNESLRYIFEADYSRTVESDKETEKYIKGATGLAYRPVNHDKLNLLSKYTYYENIDMDAESDEYQGERAHVFAVEGIYEMNAKWQVGQKVGYKRAEVRLVFDENTWYDSNTYLSITKLNYGLNETVDITGEYKYLANDLSDDRLDGIQVGIYNRFENSLKMGLGYNFAKFNDDLTNLDYESEGMFINIVKAW